MSMPTIPSEIRERISATLISKFRAPRPCDSCEKVTTVKRFGLGHYIADGTPRGKQRRFGSVDLCQECWESAQPHCLICATSKARLTRYFVGTAIYRGVGQRQRYRAAGSLYLCAKCHKAIAAPRAGKVGAQRLHEQRRVAA